MSDTCIHFSVDQVIYYSNKTQIEIKDVVKALLAAEKLFNELKPAIKKLFPEVDIKEINIYVNKLEIGSIVEDLVVDMVFGGPEEYEKFREKLRKIRGKISGGDNEDSKVMKQIIGLLLAAGIGYGISWALTTAKEPQPVPQEVTNYNVNINSVTVGEGDSALTGEQIVAVVDSLANKKEIAKSSVEFISAAKKDPQSTILINDEENLKIPQEVIAKTPANYTPALQEEKVEPYQNVPLFIVASDKDHRKRGWYGSINGIVDDRVKLVIADDLNPSELHGQLNVNADVSVIKKFDKKANKYKVTEIFVKAWSSK